MDGLGEDGEITALVSGGAADHRIVLYSTDNTGILTYSIMQMIHTAT